MEGWTRQRQSLSCCHCSLGHCARSACDSRFTCAAVSGEHFGPVLPSLQVLQAVVLWLEAEPRSRLPDLRDCLSAVRLDPAAMRSKVRAAGLIRLAWLSATWASGSRNLRPRLCAFITAALAAGALERCRLGEGDRRGAGRAAGRI
jgi:hypothetical protein